MELPPKLWFKIIDNLLSLKGIALTFESIGFLGFARALTTLLSAAMLAFVSLLSFFNEPARSTNLRELEITFYLLALSLASTTMLKIL